MKHCNSSPAPRSVELTPKLVLISLLLLLPGTLIAAGEERFGSPEAAVDALKAAVEARDTNALHAIFGPKGASPSIAISVQSANRQNCEGALRECGWLLETRKRHVPLHYKVRRFQFNLLWHLRP